MKWKLPIATSALLLLTGCSYSNTTAEKNESIESGQQLLSVTEQSEFDGDETDTQQARTPEEVISETENKLNTGVPVKLPMSLPVSEGYHLSAVTNSEQNQYSVMFLETEQPIPIDNEELENKEGNVATLKATRYTTPQLAANEIDHQNHSVSGAQEVDLGFDLKGYRDAGAGAQFIGWNEGRWSLDMRALTEQEDSIVEEATKIVQFLEKNTLPIPQEWGAVKFDASNKSGLHTQHIVWQEDAIVYEIETTKSTIEALEIAVSIHEKAGMK